MSDLTSAQEEEAADRMLDAQIAEYMEREYRRRHGLEPDDIREPPDEGETT